MRRVLTILLVFLAACTGTTPAGVPSTVPATTSTGPAGTIPTVSIPTSSVPTSSITTDPMDEITIDPSHDSLTDAWARIPSSRPLTTGYRIRILPGTIAESAAPNYWEHKWGTPTAPIIVEAVTSGTVRIEATINMFDVRNIRFSGLHIGPHGGGDAFHCEQCDGLTLSSVELDGGNRSAHETLKVNQSRNIFVEDSDIHGADDNAIDFVAVEGGHVVRSRIHDAQDWCAYAKGGSSHIDFLDNEIYDCGTGGFTAGQGTGLEFMVEPWVRYEASFVRVARNHVHDTEGAAFGVNGGYNVSIENNTAERVGSRDHLIEIVPGSRSCDGDVARCRELVSRGAWGSTDTTSAVDIPNRHVWVINNRLLNPGGGALWNHFVIRAATDVHIVGNVIVNGDGHQAISEGEGCSDGSCSDSQIVGDNLLGALTPVPATHPSPEWVCEPVQSGGDTGIC